MARKKASKIFKVGDRVEYSEKFHITIDTNNLERKPGTVWSFPRSQTECVIVKWDGWTDKQMGENFPPTYWYGYLKKVT